MNELIKRYYGDFTEAIILRAVEDYRQALKKLRYWPDDQGANETKKEVEDFFFSESFALMTDLNPKQLIERLKSEVV